MRPLGHGWLTDYYDERARVWAEYERHMRAFWIETAKAFIAEAERNATRTDRKETT